MGSNPGCLLTSNRQYIGTSPGDAFIFRKFTDLKLVPSQPRRYQQFGITPHGSKRTRDAVVEEIKSAESDVAEKR
ncbi:hypothetical protein N7507_001084 [Penicillium longicatenatum]|nr:hypothetical protein N7507_001084 [Penicillium longicatenatum]